MTKIIPVPALSDNYIWFVIDEDTKSAILFDPGDAKPADDFIQQHHLTLRAILITHHHWDHTNGVLALKEKYNVPVFTPKNDAVDGSTNPVGEGDKVVISEFPVTFDVLDIPCHTRGHIAYVGAGGVFCGDTLFSAGCGRMFEGTAEQMFASLAKLAALPNNTNVYCAHEYTLNNLRFAKEVEPDNQAINTYREAAEQKINKSGVSLPSTITIEKHVNPFLRCDQPAVKQSAEHYTNHKLDRPVDVFRTLREWKDEF